MTDDLPLKELFDRHASALVLYARQFCHDRAEAEDIVQDAFMQYWRNRAVAMDAVQYLFAAVRSRALDKRRAEQRRSKRETDAAKPERSDWFDNVAEQKEFAAIIQTSLQRLPPGQAEVVILKLWADLTFAQIGQVLAIPLNTAASRYRYAIDGLRKMMNREVMPWVK